MADWDAYIAELEAKTVSKEKKAGEEMEISHEFGDVLDESVRKKVSRALSSAQTDPMKMQPNIKREKQETSGPDWFNISKRSLTEEEKRDWEILKMRTVLQKGGANAEPLADEPPDFLQFGTVLDNPIEGQKGRVSRKYRGQTIADTLLRDPKFRQYLESKK